MIFEDEFNYEINIGCTREIIKHIIEENPQCELYNDIYNDSYKQNIFSNDYLTTTHFALPIKILSEPIQGGGKIRTIKKK